MSGRIDFTMGFKTQGAGQKNESSEGYRIYILGGFSGQSDGSWEQRKIRGIDMDNFDQVMTQVNPSLEIGSGLTLTFKALDDFHPDAWLDKVQLIADLQKLKRELNNPATAAQAAAKIQAYYQSETNSETPVTPVEQKETGESSDDIMERLLGRKSVNTASSTQSVDHFISQIISPHVTKEVDPQHQAFIKLIDSMIGQFLRILLHNPDFQHLEALWRATEALVNEDLADEQSIYLVDISQTELLAELRKGNRIFEQRLLQHVQSNDDEQAVLLIGDYSFSDSDDDRDLLGYCSHLAKASGGSFLGGAGYALIENSVLGESANSKNWTQYLSDVNTDCVILAYPRYLLRLPYGNKRDPIDAIEFEECSAIPQTEELLWGNSAFIGVRFLIKTSQGDNGQDLLYFSDIPVFSFDQDGEKVLQPATELLLNEAQANALLSKGISPLLGFRQRSGARLMAITTLSE